jgi:hypothetical protein
MSKYKKKSKATKAPSQNTISLGIHYEMPNGKIAYVYGFCGGFVSYYLDGYREGKISVDEFKQWKPREDLYDFPNAEDPRLPYAFDLYFDIKHVSDLLRELNPETSYLTPDKVQALKSLVRKENLVASLPKQSSEQIARLF